MTNFWDVYDGGRQNHLSLLQVCQQVADLGYERPEYAPKGVISDACAQTIASWWHSPAQPYTTRLSTMGKVDRYLTLDDFGTEDECEDEDAKAALRALGAYIAAKQDGAESGVRPCACDDCMDVAYGTAGQLCGLCAEAGCSATDNDMCEREDAYGAGGNCPACGDPMDYCQGHGQSGDPQGYAVLQQHENGNHTGCIGECWEPGERDIIGGYVADEPEFAPDRCTCPDCGMPAPCGQCLRGPEFAPDPRDVTDGLDLPSYGA